MLGRLIVEYDWISAIGIKPGNVEEIQFLLKLNAHYSLKCSATAFLIGKKPYRYALTSAHCVSPHIPLDNLKQLRDKLKENPSPNLSQILDKLESTLTEMEQKGIEYLSSTPPKIEFSFQQNGDPILSKTCSVEGSILHPLHMDLMKIDMNRLDSSEQFELKNRLAASDIAILKLEKEFIPRQGKNLRLCRLQGTNEELETIKNVQVFGYISREFKNQNNYEVHDNIFIRGDIGLVTQTHSSSGQTVNHVCFNQESAVFLIRLESFHGHSGAPAIVIRKGVPNVIGIVSGSYIGDECVPGLEENIRFCDVRLAAFTDATHHWITSSIDSDIRIGRLKALKFANY